jgi:hypothetical protein
MEADLGEELVALEPRGGECFGFNEVAAQVWRRLSQPADFETLRDELLGAYDVSAEQCSHELRLLLDDMIGRGLIEAVR